MSKRSTARGDFTVGGVRDRTYPTIGAAINVASRRAEQAADEVQVGIFKQESKVARCVREPDGSVTIYTLKEAS
jgi:hypothetical protein